MEDKLKVLPFQIIEMEDKLILKRGLTSMVIPEKSALIIVKIIQKAFKTTLKLDASDVSKAFQGKTKSITVIPTKIGSIIAVT